MSYLSPTRLDAALAALAEGASVVAGGTDWFAGRGSAPFDGTLLDVTRIEGLRGVTRDDTGWTFGAATTWTDVIRADLPPAFDALKAAAHEVGSVQIQNAGTMAGNICNASPAADGVPPLLALDAKVVLAGPAGERRMPLSEFIRGPRDTALDPGELVVALRVPEVPEGAGSGFVKLGARTYLVISICMVAAEISLSAGKIATARIAVGACSPVARRVAGLEAALVGLSPEEADAAVTPDAMPELTPIDDIRADAAHRRDVAAEAVRRALTQAVQGAR